MTAIHQNSITSHHSIDDAGHHSGNRNEGGAAHDRQASNNSTWDSGSSTVTISSQAVLRLKAYQEQKQTLYDDSMNHLKPTAELQNNKADANGESVAHGSIADKNKHTNTEEVITMAGQNPALGYLEKKTSTLPQYIENMLSEVQDNIVQPDEPGYQHLISLLKNNADTIADWQQLQDIMRKEQFFLNRRKVFMDSSNFQSYSQVLNQFANIVERQQFS